MQIILQCLLATPCSQSNCSVLPGFEHEWLAADCICSFNNLVGESLSTSSECSKTSFEFGLQSFPETKVRKRKYGNRGRKWEESNLSMFSALLSHSDSWICVSRPCSQRWLYPCDVRAGSLGFWTAASTAITNNGQTVSGPTIGLYAPRFYW